MSAPVCSSRFACFINGLFGTAVALCALGAAWVGYDLLSGGSSPGQALLLLPALCVIVWAVTLRLRRQPAGTLASTSAILAAMWTVVALNSGVSL
jgi:hypothetical protein